MGVEQGLVARPFAIEGEAERACADLDQSLASREPSKRLRGFAWTSGEFAIDWFERIFGEGRKDVGQQQLLMLLFMLDPEFDQHKRLGRKRRQGVNYRPIDRPSPVAHLIEAGPADHPAAGAGLAVSLALVIAVEEKGPALVEEAVAGDEIAKHEGFQEPTAVGEVPLCGRCVGVRLDGCVGVAQRIGQCHGQRAGRREARTEIRSADRARQVHDADATPG